ncbi:MAG: hypothetical protein LBS59_09345 [Puniceicoccales bacterium]|jgi:tRNA threonylcarbamoyladenosine biosynthesis protein TsaB|nr:hypothetical protein [Puniceicoccales bacterium]
MNCPTLLCEKRPDRFPADAPVLFLDAAGREVFVGVWQAGAWLACRRDGVMISANESLFALTELVLADSAVRLGDCAAFVYAEGPGSILGIRTVAMALEIWRGVHRQNARPVFAVGSLLLAARLLLRSGLVDREFSLLSDSRQGFWNALAVRQGVPMDCFEEISAAGITGFPPPFFHIARRGHPAPPVEYNPFPTGLLERDPAVLLQQGLLRETDTPDAANIAVHFVKWTQERHRAS